MNNVHSAQRYFWNPYVVSALIDVSIFSTGNGDSTCRISTSCWLLPWLLFLLWTVRLDPSLNQNVLHHYKIDCKISALCLPVRLSVRTGYCSANYQCNPGTCNRVFYRCECPDGYTSTGSACTYGKCTYGSLSRALQLSESFKVRWEI